MTLTNQYPSLKYKIVLITGGASGIGANLVEAFYQQGAQVCFIDIRDDDAHKLVAQLSPNPNHNHNSNTVPPRYYRCNLLNIPKLQATIKQIYAEVGAINVLINNAANDTRHDFRTVTVDYWNERLAVNLRHHFFAAQAVHPHMLEHGGGSIINLGSMSWYATQGGMPGYTSSKAAIEGLTRGLARDMGGDNIRVNTLVPGWVMTDRQVAMLTKDKSAHNILENQCLKKSVMPEDISAMALFLASNDSRLCTAQHFIVDGGWI